VRAVAARSVHAVVQRVDFDDCVDRASCSHVRQPWQKTYRDLWASGLSREALHFGWRLLHLGLNLGCVRLPGRLAAGDMAGVGNCMCAATECFGEGHGSVAMVGGLGQGPLPLETHVHAFWECPVVSPAVRWLWDLWTHISGQPPPFNPSVLIAGDPQVWQPASPTLRKLWLCLRVTFLHNIWRLRHRRRVEGRQFTATSIVSATCSALEGLMRDQFCMATKNLPQQCGVGLEWFRGGQRVQRLGAFEKQWCHRGVLAHVLRDPARLIVHIPMQLPV